MIMIMLSWVVALLSLCYYFARRLNKIDPNEFTFRFWIADNINELVKSSLAVIILMIIATNNETYKLIQPEFVKFPLVFRMIPYPLIAALTIGLLNFSVLELFRNGAKKKLENNIKND